MSGPVELSVPFASGDLPTLYAEPTSEAPWPGVVVVFDIIGMSHDLNRQVEWLASAGYLTVAPDLFQNGKISCIRSMVRDFARNEGPTFDTMETVRSWLAERPGCSGRIGIIGFCFGGGFALMFSPDRGFSAASANYGRLPKNFETLLAGACPVVGSYGAKDRSLRGVPAKLEAVLAEHEIDHDVKEYPDAGHGFLNNHNRSDLSALERVAMPLIGGGFHEPSAIDARKRIIEFFDRHLKGDTPAVPDSA